MPCSHIAVSAVVEDDPQRPRPVLDGAVDLALHQHRAVADDGDRTACTGKRRADDTGGGVAHGPDPGARPIAARCREAQTMRRPDEGVAGLGENDRVARIDDLALDRVHQRHRIDAPGHGRRLRARDRHRRRHRQCGRHRAAPRHPVQQLAQERRRVADGGQRRRLGERAARHLGVDVDMNEAAPRHQARVEQRRWLAEPRAEHEDPRRRVLGQPRRHRLVPADAGDADEARMRLRHDALAARRAEDGRAAALQQRQDLARGVTRAEADPDGERLVDERAQAGLQDVGGRRRDARPDARLARRSHRGLDRRRLHRRRQRDVRDEAAPPHHPARELRRDIGPVARVVEAMREMEQRAALVEAARQRLRSALLDREAAAHRRRRAGRNHDHRRAFIAGRQDACHGVGQPGPGGREDEHRAAAGERRFGRRERSAALVAAMAHAQPARRHRVPEHRHGAARDAERLLDAEREQVVDERRRQRGRDRARGGQRRSTGPAAACVGGAARA
jgi:hypothetical protein